MTLRLESDLGAPPRRRRPGLTPMVDVVFLLLVFFMLAARFGTEVTIPLLPAGSSDETPAEYQGEPRLVSVGPDFVRINGFRIAEDQLAPAVASLMPAPDALVVVRPVEGASLQRTVAILDALAAGGIRRVVLTE